MYGNLCRLCRLRFVHIMIIGDRDGIECIHTNNKRKVLKYSFHKPFETKN